MNNDYQLIDPAVLMDATGGCNEGFLQLLEIFMRTVPDMARRLDAAVAAGMHADVAREAHSLKSCMALVGARATNARLTDIERAAVVHHTVDAAGWQQLRADLDRILDEARACQAAYSATGPQP
ncbi:MAG TPA: Hpt domain-containing protein [Telluria sp.]|nr:Hpt domain-containing protein [Telluria sp.]